MQEAILTNVIHFAPIGILALLLIMVLILVANLRQTKKINKKLTDTLQKHEKSRRCSAFTGRFDGIFLLKIKGLFARI